MVYMKRKKLKHARKPDTVERRNISEPLNERGMLILNTLNFLKDDRACNGVIREIQKREDRAKFVPVLISLLKKSSEPTVRQSAAVLLGEIGSEVAKPLLKWVALSDDNEAVRKAAKSASENVQALNLLGAIFGCPPELSDKKQQLAMRLGVALRKSWDESTSSDPAKWTIVNPAWGQSEVTACVVNDHLGGKIVWAEVRIPGAKPISHCFNELDGVEIDLTKEQFPEGTSIPRGIDQTKGFATTRDYMLSFESTKKRYALFKKRVDKIMRAYESDDQNS